MHVSFTGAGRDVLGQALERAVGPAAHWRPLFLAALDEGCGLVMVGQAPQRFDVPEDRPHILVIGDDMTRSLGPPGFHLRSLRRYLARCASVTIMAGAPVAAVYAASALVATRDRKCVALIETRVEHEAEWATFVDQAAPSAAMLLASPSVAQPAVRG